MSVKTNPLLRREGTHDWWPRKREPQLTAYGCCPWCENPDIDAEFVDIGVGREQVTPYLCRACGASQFDSDDVANPILSTEKERYFGWRAPNPQHFSKPNCPCNRNGCRTTEICPRCKLDIRVNPKKIPKNFIKVLGGAPALLMFHGEWIQHTFTHDGRDFLRYACMAQNHECIGTFGCGRALHQVLMGFNLKNNWMKIERIGHRLRFRFEAREQVPINDRDYDSFVKKLGGVKEWVYRRHYRSGLTLP